MENKQSKTPKGDALADLLIASDLFTPETRKAIARAHELAQSGARKLARPLMKHVLAAARECGARSEPVAAGWGYLPCAFEPGWTDVTQSGDSLRLGRASDDETLAALLTFRLCVAPIAQGFLCPERPKRRAIRRVKFR